MEIKTSEEGSEMIIRKEKENIILENIDDFNISQTLECGQCFHFNKLGDDEYIVVAFDKMLHIKQVGDKVTLFNVSMEEYKNTWEKYFDLDRDYGAIKKYLIEQDKTLIPAIKEKYGVRILNQEFSETLMSFIISQTKQIPQIKQVVKVISESFGECVGEYDGVKYYSFPDIEKLKKITKEEFLGCKAGFRADYLVAASEYMKEEMNRGYFKGYSYEKAKKELTSIKGVGEKVANCVLLFSLGYRNAFPVDVWIKRTMEELYFHKETPVAVIQSFGEKKFGEYGGYAQQYLFYFGKTSLNKNK